MKRILRYLKGTDDLSLFCQKSDVYDLKGYSDADYAGDIVNRKKHIRYGTILWLLFSVLVFQETKHRCIIETVTKTSLLKITILISKMSL